MCKFMIDARYLLCMKAYLLNKLFIYVTGCPPPGKIRENQGKTQKPFPDMEKSGKRIFFLKIREKSGKII